MPDGELIAAHRLIDQYGNELLRRRRAKTDLAEYATLVEIPNVPLDEVPWTPHALDEPEPFDLDAEALQPLTAMPPQRHLVRHHRVICEAIHSATTHVWRGPNGEPVNVMLFFPPGSAKSTYADVVAAPHFMASAPKGLGSVLLASHGTDIAEKQGRKARQLIRSKQHINIFPNAVLDSERGAAGNWKLSNGHEFYAAGLLSGITGSRCSLGILDDPFRGREMAESETQRNKAWEAYTDDFCSRLLPGASQILIMTRWHESDIAGRILPIGWSGESGLMLGRDGRWWYVVCAPAICDRIDDPIGRRIGEGLWPEWFKPGHWDPFKIITRTWTSLYQQKPTTPSGTYFQRAWFDGGDIDGKEVPTRRYNTVPKLLNIYISSDHADTDDRGDFTVLRVWGVDTDRHIYWIDGFRGQRKAAKWVAEAIALIKKWKPICWFAENDAIFRSIEPFMRTQMRDNLAVCRIEKLSTAGDKTEKAQSFQGMAQMGMVHLPFGADGNTAVEEYVAFPGGSHDDEVDVGANMCRALMSAHPAIVQTAAAPATVFDSWGNPRAVPESDWRVV